MLTIQSILNRLTGYNVLLHSFGQDVNVNSVAIAQDNINYLDEVIYLCSKAFFLNTMPDNINAIYFIVSDEEEILGLNDYKNIVILGQDTNILKLFSDIMDQIKVAWRICEANMSISKCIYEKTDITHILQLAADILGNPIFLQDTSTKLLANSDISDLSLSGDEIIKAVLNNGYVTADLFQKYNYTRLLNLIEQQPNAFIIESPCREKASRIIVRLKVNNRYFGWVVMPSVRKSFSGGDIEIMNDLSSALSIVLENSSTISAATCHENIFLEMLMDNISSENELKTRALGFGWNLKDKYFLLTIAHKQQSTNGEHDYHSILMLAHKNQLRLLIPEVKCVIYENKLVMLLETEDSKKFEARIYNYLEANKLIGSLSMFFTDIMELKLHYKLTSDILRIGIKLKKTDIIFQYYDMHVYQFLDELKKSSPLKTYCLPKLLDLLHYDYIYNTEYTLTIREYLNTRNIVASADKLNIHRNTMQYRLKKITELTGLNLDSGEDLYYIWLSYKILDLFPDDF